MSDFIISDDLRIRKNRIEIYGVDSDKPLEIWIKTENSASTESFDSPEEALERLAELDKQLNPPSFDEEMLNEWNELNQVKDKPE